MKLCMYLVYLNQSESTQARRGNGCRILGWSWAEHRPCLQTYIVGVEAAYFLFGASLTLFIH